MQATDTAAVAEIEECLTAGCAASTGDVPVGDVLDEDHGANWTMYRGDSCEVIKGLPDDSVDLCVHSPPFSSLYVYSDSEADMGNCGSHEEFFHHYSYIIRELYRVTVPGRLCVVHCKDLPLYMGRDDVAGLYEFPDDIAKAFKAAGWTYHSRVTIWKCPVIERARTNSYGLLHNQLCRDSAASRQGMPDYLVVFRKWDGKKPDEFTKPVRVPESAGGDGSWRFAHYEGNEPPEGEYSPRDYSIQVWQRYASPVWFDIDQTDVLNANEARDEDDERHICPLQMGVIRRCVHLWSNPGDVVFSPFAGIGSEGVGSLALGRKFIGIELKDTYFATACKNLRIEEKKSDQRLLF